MAVGFIIVMGMFIKCCAVHTPSSNPKKAPARRIGDTLRRPINTLRRHVSLSLFLCQIKARLRILTSCIFDSDSRIIGKLVRVRHRMGQLIVELQISEHRLPTLPVPAPVHRRGRRDPLQDPTTALAKEGVLIEIKVSQTSC